MAGAEVLLGLAILQDGVVVVLEPEPEVLPTGAELVLNLGL